VIVQPEPQKYPGLGRKTGGALNRAPTRRSVRLGPSLAIIN
jgi:hypothetical protein